MITRVATFAMSERMLEASLRTQARMSEAQLQQASGTVSSDYGGLGRSAGTLVSLEVSLARSKSQASAAEEAGSRVQVMSDAVGAMSELLSSFRSSLSSAISAGGDDTTLTATAQSLLEEFASLLNTRFEGRYLFAGSDTGTVPVDLSAYAATDVATQDTSYYQGNGVKASVALSPERTLTYGVTGDAAAFEQAMRALSALASAPTLPDTATLQAISELTVNAIDALAAVQGKLSIDAATLERSVAAQADHQDTTTSLIAATHGADVTALAVALSSYETQLQASYAALAKVQSLNLMDYLN
ncbi:MAG TPA: flagellin [Bosea sp. (in: a-proteobacteria)]|jgi:flagellar hook-associated protein 3 FlgL|uniref:flagellin n=1 Tax=Bosea sp. (in: a-proteobacteria) TaxID=1871050 RepID=UPI002DDDBADE|nr:flagellin [Bosea sp. (in: a-proteobacteria)]HEV2555709.1 flagellin [Bosea sp. (in: a-proteobacteria)]